MSEKHKSTIIGGTKARGKTAKKTEKPGSAALIDTTIPVPSHIEGITEFRLVLNTATLKQSETIANALVVSRRLPFNPDAISISDPFAMYIMGTRPDLTGQDSVREAEGHYERFLRQAQTDSIIVAMTAYNTLPNTEPRPYLDDAEALDAEWGEDGAPEWVKAIPAIPEPKYNLNNPYEKRLKLIMDFLEDCGLEFTLQFNRVINNDLATKLREMGVEGSDEAGFQPSGDTQPVPSGDGSESVDN
jgi:hypothetical protein